jgi:hypothetical protein
MLPTRAYGQTDEFPFTSSLPVLKVTQIRIQGGFRTSRTSDTSCSVRAWYPSNGHVCHRNTTGSLHLSNLYLYALILPSENKFQFLKEALRVVCTLICSISMRWDRRVDDTQHKGGRKGQIIHRNTPGTILCCICDTEHLATGNESPDHPRTIRHILRSWQLYTRSTFFGLCPFVKPHLTCFDISWRHHITSVHKFPIPNWHRANKKPTKQKNIAVISTNLYLSVTFPAGYVNEIHIWRPDIRIPAEAREFLISKKPTPALVPPSLLRISLRKILHGDKGAGTWGYHSPPCDAWGVNFTFSLYFDQKHRHLSFCLNVLSKTPPRTPGFQVKIGNLNLQKWATQRTKLRVAAIVRRTVNR